MFGPERDEVTWEWRKLHNEELNDPYSSPNIVRVIKSKRMRWAWHVACMGERTGLYSVLEMKPGGKRPLEDPGVYWRRILRWFFRYLNVKAWTESSWHRLGIGGCSCECGSEPFSKVSGAHRLFRSVGNYQSTLRAIPEERRSRSHRGGSLMTLLHCRFSSSNCGLLGFFDTSYSCSIPTFRSNIQLPFSGLKD